jgi:signal transduction histidine kinase
MDASTSARKTAATALLTRVLRRWGQAEGIASTTPAADLAAAWQHGAAASARNSRLLALALGGTDLAFWPSDHYTLTGQPEAIRVLGCARLVLALICGVAALTLTYVAPLRRHPKGWLCVIGAAACFTLGDCFGRLGGPSTPWFHFTYLMMLAPLVCWLTPMDRVGGTVLFGGSTIVGYFFVYPEHLADPMALVALSHMAFAVALSIGAGWGLDYLRRETFLMRLALARTAKELLHLNEHLESRVEEQTAELRLLADRLESAREAERTAIARELHDELGQELTALRYALQAAQTRFERDPTGLRGNLGQLESLLSRTSATARNILVELRPRVLDELGLVAAVEWLVHRLRERDGLTCRLELPEQALAVGPDVAVAAFRIVQEALTNVARHAQASELRVTLRSERERLEIEVTDNGCGFGRGVSRGLGLLGMRERVRALKGEVQVASDPGHGTRVRVSLPLEVKAA